MTTLLDDIPVAADWIAAALQSSGYAADFSPASLWSIDRFFDENTRHGKPTPKGLLAEDTGSRIFALGSYLGEVIRREIGGTWQTTDDGPMAEVNVELILPDQSVIWPVQRVIKRLKNGAEDGVAAYGQLAGLAIGPMPT